MFETSAPFVLFDHFRVPYRRVNETPPFGCVTVEDSAAALLWPDGAMVTREGRPPDLYFLREIPILTPVLDDRRVRTLLGSTDGWEPAEPVCDNDGKRVASVWRSGDGSIFLPFDPNDAVSNVRTESYLNFGAPGRIARIAAVALRGYYSVRPFIPRSAQIGFRRTLSHLQERRRFPRWPAEPGLDDLFRYLLDLVAEIGGREVPYIAPWPKPWSWALVLTHDVERAVGYDNLHRLLEVEVEYGYTSSWNFVPCNGYVVERALLTYLREEGFEIGVHGLFHDGRDISARTLPRRLPAIRAYADHWQAVGFRSPGTLRSARLMPRLGFDYDSSFSDTAPFEPQAGGCCTWLPYLLEDLVELPITLVQDHTLFDLLRHHDETLWVEKATFLRERGGMALLLTHPDYVSNPHLVDSYRGFLKTFASDPSAWRALPSEVSAWWRRRNASTLEEVDGEWVVVGPAEHEARVEFAAPAARVTA
jgi:hypothetical protein